MPKGSGDTDKMKIHMNSFYGGGSIDFKYGIQNAFLQSQGLDFRTRASQISVLPGSRFVASNLVDLIEDMDQDLNGVRYGIGNLGNLYKIDTSNVVTTLGKLTSNGGAGIYYSQNTDQLYVSGQTTVSMYGQVTTSGNTPVLRYDNFAQSASVSPAVTNLYDATNNSYDGALRGSAAATYLVPVALSESPTDKCSFSPDIEPFYSVKVMVAAVGTGDLTLTMHDSLNNKLGAVTITNANLIGGFTVGGSTIFGQLNEFVFATPIRAIVNQLGVGNGAAYHFHLTSTTTGTTAAVVNSSDLSSCNFQLYANRLVQPHNGWHPMVPFSQYLCVGNERYLSTYDFTNDGNPIPDARTGILFPGPNNQQWVRHQLIFREGYEVCGLSTNDQFLVIALERRSTNANRNYQDGQLAFWDGGSNGVVFFIDIPMGAPYGLHTFNNITYFYVAGSLYAWAGGKTVMKVRVMAYQNSDYLNAVDSTIVRPHMIDNRYNLLMLGYPSSTTNPSIPYGIYSWGAVEMTYPNSFGLSYVMSNGQTVNSGTTNLQYGLVKNFVDTLYSSWQYTDASSVTHYGLDVVDNFSTPSPFCDWQSLIYDGGVVYKLKTALRYKIKFLSLPTGTSIKLKYQIDRGGWVYGTAVTSGSFALLELNNGRFHELQWGYEITSSGSATAPVVVTGVTMEIDPNDGENNLTAD